MTNQQGAPEALRPITRYEVVDCIDSKHVPAVIPNKDGPWVRYEDHAAALVEAQQPAPSAAAFDEHGFRDWVLRNLPKFSVIGNGEWWADHLTSWAKRFVKAAPQPSTTPQADSAQDEPLQAFDSPRAKALMRAWEEGWAACRDAEYVGEEAQNDAFNSSNTLTLCIAEDQQLPAPQADSQPAPVEVADAMADSQYLAGVSAGWNAANADDPNAALQKLHESRAGYLKPLSAARAPADSVTAPAGGAVAGPGWQMVPVKPTPEMLRAGDQKTWVLPALDCWRAMLAAAPAPLAHAADSVLEDAVGLINDIDTHMRSEWSAGRLPAACWPLAFSDRIKTIIAARKQGANHD